MLLLLGPEYDIIARIICAIVIVHNNTDNRLCILKTKHFCCFSEAVIKPTAFADDTLGFRKSIV